MSNNLNNNLTLNLKQNEEIKHTSEADINYLPNAKDKKIDSNIPAYCVYNHTEMNETGISSHNNKSKSCADNISELPNIYSSNGLSLNVYGYLERETCARDGENVFIIDHTDK